MRVLRLNYAECGRYKDKEIKKTYTLLGVGLIESQECINSMINLIEIQRNIIVY